MVFEEQERKKREKNIDIEGEDEKTLAKKKKLQQWFAQK